MQLCSLREEPKIVVDKEMHMIKKVKTVQHKNVSFSYKTIL